MHISVTIVNCKNFFFFTLDDMKAIFCIFIYFLNYVFFVYKSLYFKEILVYNVSLNLTLHIFRTLILKMHGFASTGDFFSHAISPHNPYEFTQRREEIVWNQFVYSNLNCTKTIIARNWGFMAVCGELIYPSFGVSLNNPVEILLKIYWVFILAYEFTPTSP